MDKHDKNLYRGRVIDLNLEQAALPDGSSCELEIVRHPGGAAVVALRDDAQVCLLRQFRHAAGGWLWELPAGKLDPGEPPLGTAQRELAEEAGLAAARWTALGTLWSSPGVFTEVIHLYLAQGFTAVVHAHESHEFIEVHWIPFTEAYAWACTGQVTDAKSVIGLCRAWYRLHGRAS